MNNLDASKETEFSLLKNQASDQCKPLGKKEPFGSGYLTRCPVSRAIGKERDSTDANMSKIEQLRLLNKELCKNLAQCNRNIRVKSAALRESERLSRREAERLEVSETRWVAYQKGAMTFSECVELEAADQAREYVREQYERFGASIDDYLLNSDCTYNLSRESNKKVGKTCYLPNDVTAHNDIRQQVSAIAPCDTLDIGKTKSHTDFGVSFQEDLKPKKSKHSTDSKDAKCYDDEICTIDASGLGNVRDRGHDVSCSSEESSSNENVKLLDEHVKMGRIRRIGRRPCYGESSLKSKLKR